MVDLVCPGCNGTFRVGLARAGARARCPLCHQVFVVDDPGRKNRPADGSRTGALSVAILVVLIAACALIAALTTP